MVSSRFRLQVLLRIIVLFATLVGCVYLWQLDGYLITKLLFTLLPVAQCWWLLHYVDRTNRELERFLLSIAYDDFSQSFTLPKLGGSFSELGKAFETVMERFRRTRQSREEMSQFSRMVMQQVPVAVMVIDQQDKILMVNRKVRQLFGSSALRNIDDLKQVDDNLASYLRSAGSGDRKLITATIGQAKYQLMVSVTHFMVGESVQKIVCLQNIRSELDRQEVQAWQDLIRVLSHEIMNSITPITSLSHSASNMLHELADSGDSADPESLTDLASAVETIARRSDGLLDFVERYRQVARLPQPDRSELSIDTLLEELAQLMRLELAEKNANLELELESGLPVIRADQQMVNQAIINLMRNALDAVKSVEKGYIRIHAVPDFNGGVSITVQDNGCGIPESELEKIWIPFYTTKETGSGVGLSLVRQIAHAHGGAVSIYSVVGEGTAVTIELAAE